MLSSPNELGLPYVIGISWIFQLLALKEPDHKIYWGEEAGVGKGGIGSSIHSMYKARKISMDNWREHHWNNNVLISQMAFVQHEETNT